MAYEDANKQLLASSVAIALVFSLFFNVTSQESGGKWLAQVDKEESGDDGGGGGPSSATATNTGTADGASTSIAPAAITGVPGSGLPPSGPDRRKPIEALDCDEVLFDDIGIDFYFVPLVLDYNYINAYFNSLDWEHDVLRPEYIFEGKGENYSRTKRDGQNIARQHIHKDLFFDLTTNNNSIRNRSMVCYGSSNVYDISNLQDESTGTIYNGYFITDGDFNLGFGSISLKNNSISIANTGNGKLESKIKIDDGEPVTATYTMNFEEIINDQNIETTITRDEKRKYIWGVDPGSSAGEWFDQGGQVKTFAESLDGLFVVNIVSDFTITNIGNPSVVFNGTYTVQAGDTKKASWEIKVIDGAESYTYKLTSSNLVVTRRERDNEFISLRSYLAPAIVNNEDLSFTYEGGGTSFAHQGIADETTLNTITELFERDPQSNSIYIDSMKNMMQELVD